MPTHIVRLLLLLGGFFVLAIAARNYVLDDSYYQFGDYRGDAVVELANELPPSFRGPDYCQACHGQRHAQWTNGAHATVKCEVCHGPAREHPVDGTMPKPENSIELCTVCHEAMPGRPPGHPQVVIMEHPVKHDGPLQCLTCHNPHSPRLGGPQGPVAPVEETPTAPATPAPMQLSPRLAALTAPCTPCHGVDGRNATMSAALAGAGRDELVRKLGEYRSGALQHQVMNAVTSSLSDEDIAELAGHYANLPGG